MQQTPFLIVKSASTATSEMQHVQGEIDMLYQALVGIDPGSDEKAEQVIRRLKYLEQKLVNMRIEQSDYYPRRWGRP